MPISFDAFRADQDAAAASNGGRRRPAAFTDLTTPLFDSPRATDRARGWGGSPDGAGPSTADPAGFNPEVQPGHGRGHCDAPGFTDPSDPAKVSSNDGPGWDGCEHRHASSASSPERSASASDESNEDEDCAWASASDLDDDVAGEDDGAPYDDSSAESSDWSDGGLWSDPDDDAESTDAESAAHGEEEDAVSALIAAARSGDAPAVTSILGACVSATSRRRLVRATGTGPERTTALIAACEAGRPEAVAALLESDASAASVSARDRSRRTPLHAAAAGGNLDCVTRIVDAVAAAVLPGAALSARETGTGTGTVDGVEVDVEWPEGEAWRACGPGTRGIAAAAVRQAVRTASGGTAGGTMPREKSDGVVRPPAGGTDPRRFRLSALMAEAVRAAVTATDAKGRTPLHHAARAGHATVCAALVREWNAPLDEPEGAQFFAAPGDGIDGLGSWRGSPLHGAARHGREDAVEALLNLGARPEAVDPATNRTPVHAAAKRGVAGQALDRLLGAPGGLKAASMRDNDGRTAIHAAAKSGAVDVIRRLTSFSRGAGGGKAGGRHAAGARDARGRNAMHLAVKHGHVAVAEALAELAPELLLDEDDAGWDAWTLLDMGGAPGLRARRPELQLTLDGRGWGRRRHHRAPAGFRAAARELLLGAAAERRAAATPRVGPLGHWAGPVGFWSLPPGPVMHILAAAAEPFGAWEGCSLAEMCPPPYVTYVRRGRPGGDRSTMRTTLALFADGDFRITNWRKESTEANHRAREGLTRWRDETWQAQDDAQDDEARSSRRRGAVTHTVQGSWRPLEGVGVRLRVSTHVCPPGFGGFVKPAAVDAVDEEEGADEAEAAPGREKWVDVTLRARRVGSRRMELWGPLTKGGDPVSFWRRA